MFLNIRKQSSARKARIHRASLSSFCSSRWHMCIKLELSSEFRTTIDWFSLNLIRSYFPGHATKIFRENDASPRSLMNSLNYPRESQSSTTYRFCFFLYGLYIHGSRMLSDGIHWLNDKIELREKLDCLWSSR